MKKVLLSSVAALAVFAAAAPAFASDNSYSSNALIQKHYVSERDIADEANTQVAAHEADINAEAEKAAAVVAANKHLKHTVQVMNTKLMLLNLKQLVQKHVTTYVTSM